MITSAIYDYGMVVTIDRPERRNALNGAMYKALTLALCAAQDDSHCNALILTGSQDCFNAGNDLTEFQAERGLEDSPALVFLRTLAAVDVPVIAAVEGPAVGVGVTLLQHCDFVYASETALFSMPFVSLGLCPEGGSSLLMAQLVGPRRAAEWLLLGKQFSAREACDAGLVTAVTPAGQALTHARATAVELSLKPSQALRSSKRLMRQAGQAALTHAFNLERDLFTERLNSQEAQEAFRAFFDRKKK